MRAALTKSSQQERSRDELDHAIRQLVSKTVVAEGQVIDVFSAAGLDKPDISILSDQFLVEVRDLPTKNVAAETLAKLLGDELQARSRRNVVQARRFSEMLKKAMGIDELKVIATELVIKVRGSVSIDWTMRESARARIRVIVRRIWHA